MYGLCIALVLAAFVATGYLLRGHYNAKLAVAQADVTSAHKALVLAEAQARLDSALSAHLTTLADSQSALAARQAKLRKLAETASQFYQTKYLLAVKAAPDTCTTVIAAANAALGSKDTVIASLLSEVDTIAAARDSYRASAAKAMDAYARLLTPVARLDTASTALVKASRTSFWAKVTPKLGLGAFTGVDQHGQFVYGAGLTLGYQF